MLPIIILFFRVPAFPRLSGVKSLGNLGVRSAMLIDLALELMCHVRMRSWWARGVKRAVVIVVMFVMLANFLDSCS